MGVGGWVGVDGLAENKANSAPIELELELSLAKTNLCAYYHCTGTNSPLKLLRFTKKVRDE